jgi:hypothetical protein
MSLEVTYRLVPTCPQFRVVFGTVGEERIEKCGESYEDNR